MKILVTGGAGFIGSHLCERLATEGHEVHVLDNLLPQVHGNPLKSPTFIKASSFSNFHLGDCSKKNSWKVFYGKYFDAIVFLSSETGTGQSMMEAKSYCNSNITSLALLNDLLLQKKVQCGKVVLASSRSIYGDAMIDYSGNPLATKEDDSKNPRSVYAVTKLAQEQILFCGFKNVNVCALRFQNVYGPGQSLKNPYTGILSIFTNAFANGRNVHLFSDGLMTRDFVFVSDVVDSIILAINSTEMNSRAYNVGSGKATTVLEVASKIKDYLKANSEIIVTGEDLVGDIRNNFADITEISSFGFSPKVSFDEGLKMFLDWALDYGNLEYNNYENSLEELRKTGLLSKKN